MKKIYLGLGTNLGDKKQNLMQAIEKLSLALGNAISVSPFIETEAWGFSSQNSFLNCVVEFSTAMEPHELLKTTEQIEKHLGRTNKSTSNGYSDRIIDIDILLYADDIIESPTLSIPHPLMHKRLFVLEPMAQIAPQVIHPIHGKSIKQLLDDLIESNCATEA